MIIKNTAATMMRCSQVKLLKPGTIGSFIVHLTADLLFSNSSIKTKSSPGICQKLSQLGKSSFNLPAFEVSKTSTSCWLVKPILSELMSNLCLSFLPHKHHTTLSNLLFCQSATTLCLQWLDLCHSNLFTDCEHLLAAISQYFSSSSMPSTLTPKSGQASRVEPLPINGSRTIPLGGVMSLIR